MKAHARKGETDMTNQETEHKTSAEEKRKTSGYGRRTEARSLLLQNTRQEHTETVKGI